MRNLLLQLILVIAAAAAIFFYIDAGPDKARHSNTLAPVPHKDEVWAGTTPPQAIDSEPGLVTESMETPSARGLDISPPTEKVDFRIGYSNLTPTELAQEYIAVDERWQGQIARACEERILAGRYEVTGYGDRLPLSTPDETPLVIYQLVALPDQQTSEIRKIVLPEEEYPEAYELYRRASWLSDKLRQR
jgi:hypothetical protein